MKVLIMDDSNAVRMILAEIMKNLGFEIYEAENCEVAFEVLASKKPELVLVDWNMPGMNGLEFAQKVRSLHEYDALLLMMVTTETKMDRVKMALSAGVNEYVMKPFTTEIIVDKLRLLGVPLPT